MSAPKYCKKCDSWKDSGDFGRDRSSSDGFTFRCRLCMNEMKRTWCDGNREKVRQGNRDRAANNKEQRAAYNSRRGRVWQWKKRGLDMEFEEWEEHLRRANGMCEVPGCGRTENLRPDHDHETGRFRGVLCHSHNIAFGQMGDNAEGLERGLAYLRMAEIRGLVDAL